MAVYSHKEWKTEMKEEINAHSTSSAVLLWARTETLSFNVKLGENYDSEISKVPRLLQEALNYFLLIYPAFEEERAHRTTTFT